MKYDSYNFDGFEMKMLKCNKPIVAIPYIPISRDGRFKLINNPAQIVETINTSYIYSNIFT